jgi:hypothetical protein
MMHDELSTEACVEDIRRRRRVATAGRRSRPRRGERGNEGSDADQMLVRASVVDVAPGVVSRHRFLAAARLAGPNIRDIRTERRFCAFSMSSPRLAGSG